MAEAGAASEGKLQSGALRSEFCYFVMRKVVGMRKEEAEVFVAKGMGLGLGDGRSVWRRVAGLVFEECLKRAGEVEEQVGDKDEFKERAIRELMKLDIFDLERLLQVEDSSLLQMSEIETSLDNQQKSIRFNGYRASRAYKHESNDKAFI